MARCIPLYNTLTGLDINFKIKVTPEQDVEVKIANTVAKKLKLRVSSLLTNIVSLQSRDIAVWFMPKSDGTTVHFYLIDIFVYNASKKVVYNRAVMELQDFFKTIKFLNRLQISKEIALGLKYDIGRMLDYGAQLRNLHFLMGERLDYDKQPQNHVTISDINWCVRTEFTADDIEKLGRAVYKIKQTNTILYKDQYDSDFNGDSHYLYACIDNFVDDKVKVRRMIKIPNHVHTTPTMPGDTKDAKDANGRLSLPGITTAVAVLLAVIFTIVLVKIKSRPTPRE